MSWTIAGKTCLITGATSGIGRAAAVELARRGARLVLVARDAGRAEETVAEIEMQAGFRDVTVLHADLASLADVRRVAAEFLALGCPLHVLVNNAGLVMTRRELTVDGLEHTLAVNHYAPFLLTNLLLERLHASAPARVVTVSSVGHKFAGRIDPDCLEPPGTYRGMRLYCISKLANVLFTRELARRLAGSGVDAYSMHPGSVATRFGQNTDGILNWGSRLIAWTRRTPAKGAETIVYLCTEPQPAGASGDYFVDCRARPTSRAGRDLELARRLWEASARTTGLAPT
ncbi:MAG TPA: SDR family oxidoreductase [Candidatus Limnocylindria bacterium]|nr:SDR family oxidoreductase [Candidatus Limnocylindria bacterium]